LLPKEALTGGKAGIHARCLSRSFIAVQSLTWACLPLGCFHCNGTTLRATLIISPAAPVRWPLTCAGLVIGGRAAFLACRSGVCGWRGAGCRTVSWR